MVPESRRIDPPAAELADYDRAARARTVPGQGTTRATEGLVTALWLSSPNDRAWVARPALRRAGVRSARRRQPVVAELMPDGWRRRGVDPQWIQQGRHRRRGR